jgi:hypothetical protein
MWLVRYILIAWSAAQEPRGLEKLTAVLVVAAFVLNLIYLILNRPAERG